MFFDNASTTKVDKEIIEKVNELNDEFYYNPSSLYSAGRRVKKLIEECRGNILNCLNAVRGTGLVFTGSATEANNIALLGSVKKNTKKILVSSVEHPSVYNTALELKNRGYDVEFLKVNSNGVIDIEYYKSKLSKDVDLISVMHVNNETGAVNDIAYLVELAREINPNVIFHSDGVQAVGKIEVDLDDLGVDLYSMSAHKIHGFKGVGALYIKNQSKLKPIVFGGGQENNFRSGTENLLGIYSLSKAIENAVENQIKNYKHILNLKNNFINEMALSGLEYVLHSKDKNVPNIISISFKSCRAETLLNMLSDSKIFVANGSACSSKKSGNRVLESMGVSLQDIEGNLRISFSKYNTVDEVNKLVEILKIVVNKYLLNAR